MGKDTLKRTTQCAKCPWKVGTNPHEIPNGYCELKHRNLENTIAKDSSLSFGGSINAMACHHSKEGSEDYCVGWLHNQLGVGNNIPLRIKMLHYSNAADIKVVGKQHKEFKDTLPK